MNTLFQEIMNCHNQKDGFRETRELDPYWKLYGKHGIEIRIWSLSGDNTQSWVRISHGSNKFVVDSNFNNTEVPADLPEEQTSQSSVKNFAVRSKAKAKPQRREPVEFPSIIPMNERNWIDIEPGNLFFLRTRSRRKSSIFFDTVKRYNEKTTVQFDSGGSRMFFKINFHKSIIGRMISGKHAWQQEEDQKEDISTALIFREQFFTSELFKDIQDVISLILHYRRMCKIKSGFFKHIYTLDVLFNLHSIINNGLIPGGQNSSKRQTVFLLLIDPRDKGHQDLAKIDFTVPRRAQYLHSAWKKHQDAVIWVDINLAIQKGLTFYQTRSNAIVLQGTLPAYCIPKVVRLKTGEVLYEKSYISPRPPPKISLRHDHDWTRGNVQLGSTVEQQPHGKVVQQSCGEVQRAKFSQLTQPNPKPICDRPGKPDNMQDLFVVKGETSPSHEINEKVFTKNSVLQIDPGNLRSRPA